MPTRRLSVAALALLVTFAIAPSARAQTPAIVDDAALTRPPAGDWLSYGRDYAETHHSPLTQIDQSNIARLAPALIRRSPRFNFALLTVLSLLGLAGAALAPPLGLGLVPVASIHAALLLTGYLVSHYLNAVTDSTQRATVLSFKGLAFNLGYGTLGLLYAGLLTLLRETAGGPGREEMVFQDSLPWLLGYGVTACLLFAAIVAVRMPAGWLKRLGYD